jgi:hypothetical protein
MGRIPKPVRNPQKMVDPRAIAPIDQISRYYGGQGATQQAIRDARELGRQLTAIDDIDGGEYRRMFPELDYSTYDDEIAVLPMGEGDPRGDLMRPSDPSIAEENMIQLRDGQTFAAPSITEEMPAIAFGVDPSEYDDASAMVTGAASDFALGPDELDSLNQKRLGEAKQRANLYESVEGPMTDYVTGTPSDQFAEMDAARIVGSDLDRVLAQIRRTSGASFLEPDQARGMIGNAMQRADLTDDPTMIDQQTGLRMRDLQLLQMLGPEQMAFLPKRIRELLSLGGISTGLLSQGGEQRQQGIDPRSTMGPLGGLMD